MSIYKQVTQDANDRVFLVIYCDYKEPEDPNDELQYLFTPESKQQYLFNNVYGNVWEDWLREYNTVVGQGRHTIKLQHVGLRTDGTTIDPYIVDKPNGYYAGIVEYETLQFPKHNQINTHGFSSRQDRYERNQLLLKEILETDYLWLKLQEGIEYDKNVKHYIDNIILMFPESVRANAETNQHQRMWKTAERAGAAFASFNIYPFNFESAPLGYYLGSNWNPLTASDQLLPSPATMLHEYTHFSVLKDLTDRYIHGLKVHHGNNTTIPDFYIESGNPLWAHERYKPMGEYSIMADHNRLPPNNCAYVDMAIKSLLESDLTLIEASGTYEIEDYLDTRKGLIVQSRTDLNHYYVITYKNFRTKRTWATGSTQNYREGLHIQSLRESFLQAPLGMYTVPEFSNWEGYPYKSVMVGNKDNTYSRLKVLSEENELTVAGNYPIIQRDGSGAASFTGNLEAFMCLCDYESFGGVKIELLSETTNTQGHKTKATVQITLSDPDYNIPDEMSMQAWNAQRGVLFSFPFTLDKPFLRNWTGEIEGYIGNDSDGYRRTPAFLRKLAYNTYNPTAKHFGIEIALPEEKSNENIKIKLLNDKDGNRWVSPIPYSTIGKIGSTVPVVASHRPESEKMSLDFEAHIIGYSGIKAAIYLNDVLLKEVVTDETHWGDHLPITVIFDSLYPDTRYTVKAKYYIGDYEFEEKSFRYSTLPLGAEPEDVPTILSFIPRHESIRIKHKTIPSALSYTLNMFWEGGLITIVADPSEYDIDGYYLIEGLKAGMTYRIGVEANMGDDEVRKSGLSYITTEPMLSASINTFWHITRTSAIMTITPAGGVAGEQIRVKVSLSMDMRDPVQDFTVYIDNLIEQSSGSEQLPDLPLDGLRQGTNYYASVQSFKEYSDGYIVYGDEVNVGSFRTKGGSGLRAIDIFKGRFPRII